HWRSKFNSEAVIDFVGQTCRDNAKGACFMNQTASAFRRMRLDGFLYKPLRTALVTCFAPNGLA
ncbi:MAG: hypothetical protein COZ09_14695, partial [Comamonadaceae bacterium CG_4_10_14_3_um_filter_60_42]